MADVHHSCNNIWLTAHWRHIRLKHPITVLPFERRATNKYIYVISSVLMVKNWSKYIGSGCFHDSIVSRSTIWGTRPQIRLKSVSHKIVQRSFPIRLFHRVRISCIPCMTHSYRRNNKQTEDYNVLPYNGKQWRLCIISRREIKKFDFEQK